MKVIFRNYRAHYSEEDLVRMEGDDIFIPQVGDTIMLDCITGKVIKRVIVYDLPGNEVTIKIGLNFDE